jgi:hypothetical protein
MAQISESLANFVAWMIASMALGRGNELRQASAMVRLGVFDLKGRMQSSLS